MALMALMASMTGGEVERGKRPQIRESGEGAATQGSDDNKVGDGGARMQCCRTQTA